LRPWRYPLESFFLQQGAVGLWYAWAAIDFSALLVGDFSKAVLSTTILANGLLCTGAAIVANTLKKPPGWPEWTHPRTVASAALFVCTCLVAVAAVQTSSVFLGAAAACFGVTNVLTDISRRRARAHAEAAPG
jgi:hypothetical protein